MSKEKFMVDIDGKIKSEAEVAKVPTKKREENLTERFERLHHLYDDGPKPDHYDNKSIVDMDKWNSMKGLEKKTPVVNKTSIAEQQMIKVARQPDSRGTFKKLVKEDEDNYQKSLKVSVLGLSRLSTILSKSFSSFFSIFLGE